MSDRIGVGDKVMVVWGCCAEQRKHIGVIASVRQLFPNKTGVCHRCGLEVTTTYAALHDQEYWCGWPVPWLKKMPPAGDIVEARETQELSA